MESFGAAARWSESVAAKAVNAKRRGRLLSALSVNWLVPDTRTGIEKLPTTS
jgi:hypothetical protein